MLALDELDMVVIGAGPWVRDFWDMLELPKQITVRDPKNATRASESVPHPPRHGRVAA